MPLRPTFLSAICVCLCLSDPLVPIMRGREVNLSVFNFRRKSVSFEVYQVAGAMP